MASYEIEIKSLLGSAAAAARLRQGIKKARPDAKLMGTNTQLNHYFTGGGLAKLYDAVRGALSKENREKFAHIAEKAKTFSVRTREHDKDVILVVKASIDDTTSSNGIARIEFEAKFPGLTLDELDRKVLGAGFSYQAKWSREREEYDCGGAHVTIDKNAGYGYVAEFERVVDDAGAADTAKEELRALMAEVGAEELPQDRLERMFAYYNEHWPEYYGTDKVFVIQ